MPKIGKKTETRNTAFTTRQIGMEQHLTDFMIENRLTCLNTNLSKKGREKLWTYTYTNNSKVQIDYVFIRIIMLINYSNPNYIAEISSKGCSPHKILETILKADQRTTANGIKNKETHHDTSQI